MLRQWLPSTGRITSNDIISLDTETVLIDDGKPDDLDNVPRLIISFVHSDQGTYWVSNANLASFLKTHVDCTYIIHNCSFDFFVIKKELKQGLRFFNMAEKIRDTMLMHRLYHIAKKGYDSHKWSLQHCASEYLDIEISKDTDIRTGFGQFIVDGVIRYDLITPEYFNYGAEDAKTTYKLYFNLIQRMVADGFEENEWGWLTDRIQTKAAIALRQIQLTGMRVDKGLVSDYLKKLRAYRVELDQRLAACGFCRGKGSGAKIQQILSEIEQTNNISLPRTVKTKKISAKADDLEPYVEYHPFISSYIELNKVGKVIKTYLEKLEDKDMVHPRINVIVNTGRTSSGGGYDGINSQNFPRNPILDCDVRKCFLPLPDHYIFAIDYSQIELVVLSQICLSLFGYSVMAEKINAGLDVHKYLAAHIYNIDMADVTSEQRQGAKACNFGFPGMLGPEKMVSFAKTTYGVTWTIEQAREIKEFWLSAFPEMREWVKTDNHRLYDRFELGTDPWLRQNPDITCALFLRIASGETASRQGKPYTTPLVEWAFDRMNEHKQYIPEKFWPDISALSGSPDLKQSLSKVHTSVTLTGRCRDNVGVNAQKNTQFQGLAADVAKLATFEFVKRGYKVCNFIHDEVLVHVHRDEISQEWARNAEELWLAPAKKLLPDMTAKAEYTVSDRWVKKSCWQVDASGLVIPYHVEV